MEVFMLRLSGKEKSQSKCEAISHWPNYGIYIVEQLISIEMEVLGRTNHRYQILYLLASSVFDFAIIMQNPISRRNNIIRNLKVDNKILPGSRGYSTID